MIHAEHLRQITYAILDPTRPPFTLRDEVAELKKILEKLAPSKFDEQSDISAGETRTPRGVAISPRMASMCVDDFARTVQFIRGIASAIESVGMRSGRTVRVLYAGCGPWAPLAVPLMSIHDPATVQFTLLDIHEESISSAKRVVEALKFDAFVESCEEADAADYKIVSPPDVIVIEMLQHALQKEPQVAVALHLVQQAPDCILIPEQIRIDLALVNSAREFSTDESRAVRDRVALGTVFQLDRAAIETRDLAPVRIKLPDFDTARFNPMLLTTVVVYGDTQLTDYESGITLPKKLQSATRPRDTIEFSYEIGANPGLRERVVS